MGLFSKVAKVGLAKKVYDEARKPENQAKIKRMIADFQRKQGGGGAGRGRGPGH